jgi:hypothetical protein
MVLIKRNVETPRSPSMVARSLAGPTSRRPQVINVAQYPRIPSRILKSASYEEVVDNMVAVFAMSGGWSTMKPKIC